MNMNVRGTVLPRSFPFTPKGEVKLATGARDINDMKAEDVLRELRALTGRPLDEFEGTVSTPGLRVILALQRENAQAVDSLRSIATRDNDSDGNSESVRVCTHESSHPPPVDLDAIVSAIGDRLSPMLARIASSIPQAPLNGAGGGTGTIDPGRFPVPVPLVGYINPEPALSSVLGRLSDEGQIVNVIVHGPTGAGKTTFAEQFASAAARPFFKLDNSFLIEADQLFGQWKVSKGSTEFVPSEFLAAVQTPSCVILLDEINRGDTRARNAFFPLLDHTRRANLDALDSPVIVAPGVTFFVTINEGSEYTGADQLDAALYNRCQYGINIEYLSAPEEVLILASRFADGKHHEDIVRLGRNLRGEAPVSLRQMIACAELVRCGMTVAVAAVYTFGAMDGITRHQLDAAIDLTLGID